MRTLGQLLDADAAAMRRAADVFTPEDYRNVLEGAAPIFREQTIRDAFPVRILDDFGVTKSRHINVVDINAAEFGMRGTGGTFEQPDKSTTDVPVYAIWKNIEVRMRDQATSQRGNYDLLQQGGQVAGEKVVEKENTLIVNGLGAAKGLTNATGIQTFASAGAWTTAGIAWADLIKAGVAKFAAEKVPRVNRAILVNGADLANLYTTFSNTDTTQLDKIQSMFPGGIYESNEVTVGKAYVYPKTPTVVEYVVYHDLRVIPLPKVDEDHRLRVRVAGALHVKKPKGIVEITSIDS